jgi:hypothetical protein
MHSQSIPTYERKQFPPNTPSKLYVSWLFALVCCLYYLLAYLGLASATPIFAKMFEGLEVALPLPTRLLMASYSWLFPVFFVGAVILTIAKQFVPLEKRPLRLANLFLIVVGVAFAPLVVFTLYLPLLDLIWKLHFAK